MKTSQRISEIKKRIKLLAEKAEYFYMYDDGERWSKMKSEISDLEEELLQLEDQDGQEPAEFVEMYSTQIPDEVFPGGSYENFYYSEDYSYEKEFQIKLKYAKSINFKLIDYQREFPGYKPYDEIDQAYNEKYKGVILEDLS